MREPLGDVGRRMDEVSLVVLNLHHHRHHHHKKKPNWCQPYRLNQSHQTNYIPFNSSSIIKPHQQQQNHLGTVNSTNSLPSNPFLKQPLSILTHHTTQHPFLHHYPLVPSIHSREHLFPAMIAHHPIFQTALGSIKAFPQPSRLFNHWHITCHPNQLSFQLHKHFLLS